MRKDWEKCGRGRERSVLPAAEKCAGAALPTPRISISNGFQRERHAVGVSFSLDRMVKINIFQAQTKPPRNGGPKPQPSEVPARGRPHP